MTRKDLEPALRFILRILKKMKKYIEKNDNIKIDEDIKLHFYKNQIKSLLRNTPIKINIKTHFETILDSQNLDDSTVESLSKQINKIINTFPKIYNTKHKIFEYYIEEEDSLKCKQCNYLYRNNTTLTTLKKHFINKHKDIWNGIRFFKRKDVEYKNIKNDEKNIEIKEILNEFSNILLKIEIDKLKIIKDIIKNNDKEIIDSLLKKQM
jgi:hypothetical protein